MAKSHGAVLQADLALWRTSWWRKWLRTYGVQLGVYYVMGVLVYGHLEGWNPLDVCYFLTTTVTTVGYGDFAPSSYAGRWLTSLYAPLGTVAVISALNPAVDCTRHTPRTPRMPRTPRTPRTRHATRAATRAAPPHRRTAAPPHRRTTPHAPRHTVILWLCAVRGRR
jgi:hypothetical protein